MCVEGCACFDLSESSNHFYNSSEHFKLKQLKNYCHLYFLLFETVSCIELELFSWNSCFDCRNSKKSKRMSNSTLQKEVIGISKSGETHSLAELVGKEWLLLDSHWSLQLQTCSGDEGYLLELVGGSRIVSVHPLHLTIFFLKTG